MYRLNPQVMQVVVVLLVILMLVLAGGAPSGFGR